MDGADDLPEEEVPQDEDYDEEEAQGGDADSDDEKAAGEAQSAQSAPLTEAQLEQARLDAAFEAQRKAKIRRQREIYNRLTPSQRSRYVAFIQSTFRPAHMRRVMSTVLGASKVTEQLAIVMIAITKMYVGDLVESCVEIMEQWGDTGAIRPVHIREAHRRLIQGQLGSVTGRQQRRLLL
ncbi:TAFII28-like protein domain-containing protein [Plasmodiophora brassicae]|uniref:TAFII28-like protein domain-containing protein n=1 Tax=Plasmodiophora brassicae TaxID=37360 RepID=A0A0G4IHX1_PLABS|nr:hypothetical protein PBRA_003639 [Plasmodiophora brassicae]